MNKRLVFVGVVVVLPLLILGTVAVHAQAGGGASTLLSTGASTLLSTGYDLTWNTVDNGGVTFNSSGDYELGGTAGHLCP